MAAPLGLLVIILKRKSMKIQLGMIVTQMAGSVAGQTVRRYRGGHIFQNKAQYTANSINGRNRQISLMSSVFRAWSQLTNDERNQWNAVAPGYTFPDKFGNPVVISGRALFTKLSAVCLAASLAPPVPTALDATLPYIDWTPIEWEASQATYDIDFTSNIYPVKLILKACRLRFSTNVVSPRRASLVEYRVIDSPPGWDCRDAFIAKFGTINEGDCFMLTLTPVSPSGFLGATLVQNIQFL